MLDELYHLFHLLVRLVVKIQLVLKMRIRAIRAMRMGPRRIVMKKKMKNKIVVMISWEKRGLQTIPPIGGNANANANADHPSRANGLCHFSRRATRNALTCPTRSVLISCAYMSAKIF
jgi:hypothetical protein